MVLAFFPLNSKTNGAVLLNLWESFGIRFTYSSITCLREIKLVYPKILSNWETKQGF